MKKILVHIADSNITRNILRTKVLSTLVDSDEVGEIVLVVNPRHEQKYQNEFGSNKVQVVAGPMPKLNLFELASWFLVRHTIHTNNVLRKMAEIRDRSTGFRQGKYTVAWLTFYASKWRPFNSLIRRLTYLVFQDQLFAPVMNSCKPDLVFMPTNFGNNDIRLLKYCKKHQVPVVGMIKSWDNILGKDPFLIAPDQLIVHSETVKSLVTDLHQYEESKIYVTGIPQYDVYADEQFPDTKENFFKELGLDPNKRLIVYAAMGSWIVMYEKEIIAELAEIVGQGVLNHDSQLLVRLHPAYKSEDELLKNIPNITIDRPGNSNFDSNPWRADFEFEAKDTKRLVNTLIHADVCINSGSTMTIDAAALGCPVININYDAVDEEVPFERSAKRLLVKEHYLPILESGGVSVVDSKQELVNSINAYYADREKDAAGRSRIVRENCYKIDGQSGYRIAKVILDYLARIE